MQVYEKPIAEMNLRYFKKYWNETTGDELTDSWGISTYYFETDINLNVTKQLQLFQNGKTLKYDEQNTEDEFGFLANQPLEIHEFINYEIDKNEFDEIWTK